MNVLIILIFSTLHGANIREIYDIAKEFLVFNIEVPQISRIYTDFFAACAAEDKRVTQISQMTQIFSTYPQMRPIRSDDADFLRPLLLDCMFGWV